MTAWDEWAVGAYAREQAAKDRAREMTMGVVTGLWLNVGTGGVVIEYEDGNAGIVLVEPDSDVVILDVFDAGPGWHKLV